ncbi:S8 family serine peptidase [Streptosporangium sp. NBC_01755]|uniref:S8 family peptidase n=1 Tax=Streptosporangium sp. NBC_01755 TaxID=2975949 RepID=UPI002DD8807C|nr:S8 family serine peptidase [Streptosporangium sp. NBC_01755]WSC99065.1 S8 family serine peptidase [Streptosporangium sp. NBC_01755]
MRRGIRGLTGAGTVLALAATLTAGALDGGAATVASQAREYLVFYADGAHDRAIDAIDASGGTALSTETRLGYIVAGGPASRFVEDLAASDAVVGVSSDRRIGSATALPATGAPALPATGAPAALPPSDALGQRGTPDGRASATGASEPLAGQQWDMKMIGATADGSHATAPGSKQVLVGVIDTGIDGRHPDIAPNFNYALSRNFVTDRPKDPAGKTVDGPCEFKNCKDPVDWDDDGHGTHVAGTIASPVNGRGVAGVAPAVSLVNLRAGQDSGLFFLKPSIEALTYAADAGIDVVNMSFYVDPWLFNCKANPADSKAEQLEQRGVVTGMQRALDYARKRGVTLISAIGNGSTDLGRPSKDDTSPDYPKDVERTRKIDNSCLNVPAESKGVISVSAVGPSKRKAYYSDYGIEQADLSAPGGDEFDGGTGYDITKGILAPAPENALRAKGQLNADGTPKYKSIIRECRDDVCAYYQYLVGTSMAAPHATGVAAILISRFGKPDKSGLTMAPGEVQRLLYATATEKACPSSRKYAYKIDLVADEVHKCEGSKARNGFYGRGIVDAAGAASVTR